MSAENNRLIFNLIAACANSLKISGKKNRELLFLNAISELAHFTRSRLGHFNPISCQNDFEELLQALSEVDNEKNASGDTKKYFTQVFSALPFKPEDYQESLLKYLLFTGEEESVISTLESFISHLKTDLSLADFQRTRTGAMRCFTNTRFAANALRDYGLIRDDSSHLYKRWDITLLGLLVIDEMVPENLGFKLCHNSRAHTFEKYPLADPINSALTKFENPEAVIKKLQAIAGEPFDGFKKIASTLSSHCTSYTTAFCSNLPKIGLRDKLRKQSNQLLQDIDNLICWTALKAGARIRIQSKPTKVVLPPPGKVSIHCLQCDKCGFVFILDLFEPVRRNQPPEKNHITCPACPKQVDTTKEVK